MITFADIEIDDNSLQASLKNEMNKFQRQTTTAEKYHESYKCNKKYIKEWGLLMKKTKIGAQKLLNSKYTNSLVSFDNNYSMNNMAMIINQTKEMITHFYETIELYENELIKQHQLLKEQGKELYRIEKACKEGYKTEKGVFDQFTKKCLDAQQKLTQTQFIRQVSQGNASKNENTSSVQQDQSKLFQTNQNFYKTSTSYFLQQIQIFYYQIEQQQIISNTQCMESAKSIQKAMKAFNFDKLPKYIPDLVAEQNEKRLMETRESIQKSQMMNEVSQKTLKQSNLYSNPQMSKFQLYTQNNIENSRPYTSHSDCKQTVLSENINSSSIPISNTVQKSNFRNQQNSNQFSNISQISQIIKKKCEMDTNTLNPYKLNQPTKPADKSASSRKNTQSIANEEENYQFDKKQPPQSNKK